MNRLIILLTLFSVFCVWNAFARSEYKFRTLSPKGGFYYDGVKKIRQDGDGFIWILMDNDLQRFDGYEYKRYYSHFQQPGSSQRLLFEDLIIDTQGVLYVSTAQGFFRYDGLADSFVKISDDITNMYPDERRNMWVKHQNRLALMHGPDSLEIQYFNDRTIGNISASENCADGSFIVGSSFGRILRYDYDSRTFSALHVFPNTHSIIEMQGIGDKLWVLFRSHGLVAIDITTGEVVSHYDFFLQYEGREVPSKDFQLDKYGNAWIATQQGIWFFNTRTEEYRLYRHSEADIFSIPNNSVWAVTEDANRNIWIGTFCGGLCMVDPDENKSFTTYTAGIGGLNHNMVSAFALDDSCLWIGTEGGGVNRMDKKTGAFSYLESDLLSEPLPGNNIKSLLRDRRDGLWIATYLGGLIKYDIRTGAYTHFGTRTVEEDKRLLSNDLRKIVAEGETGIWIAYQLTRHVVSFMSCADESLTHCYFDTEDAGMYILDMCRNGNYLWIITPRKLYRMNVRDRSVDDVSSGKIPYLNAQSLCADDQGNIWIGTVGSGILKYDILTGGFITFQELSGQNVSSVFSMEFDGDGNLWMGTDNGLFRYVPSSGTYSRFDGSDGVQGKVYCPLAVSRGPSGELLFGGTNGFSIVDPSNITFNDQQPKVIISNFFVDNEPSVPRFGKEAPTTYYGNEIVLTHKDTSFGFQFATDSYLIPQKNRFRYQLKGYDPVPRTTGADNRIAVYSKVPPGTYRFEITAANNDGVWGEPVNIKIFRRPAPWASPIAFVLYVMAGLAVGGAFMYYSHEKRRLKMQLYLDSVDKHKQEELHQTQLRFFTNVSHDFRTPLSLILGAVDNLRRDGIDDYYYRILNGNSQRLLNLVNELMDFRTVEEGELKLQVQPADVNRFVHEIAADFIDYAREKNIDFRIECDPELSSLVYIDKHIVEKIVMNLLINAFKYTPKGGSILIATYGPHKPFESGYRNSYRIAADTQPASGFVIAVRDTGVGISGESIANVFERFYKVKTTNTDSHLGTGIGLALVKGLVLLHKGAITIFSAKGEGTDMVVEFPAGISSYSAENFFRKVAEGEEGRYIEVEPDNSTDDAELSESMFLRNVKRILLVEDNTDLRTLIANFLSSDYEIVQAADGMIASEYLANNEIDLIISDIMMPGKDGVALCREVKDDIATSHIPFIILTAKTSVESKLESAGSGADLYFEKPVDLNLLLMSVDNIFKQQNKLREYYARNYFADSGNPAANDHDNAFLKKLLDTIDRNLTEPVIDVNFIASELSMSRSKLYSKVKAMTDKSIVEFILNYRLRKAARMIIEEDMSIQQVMERIGIRSQSYFTNVFKKEFGETPSVFAKTHKNQKNI